MLKELGKPQKLQIAQGIPYRAFKEKIGITKRYGGKGYIEVFKGFVYVENKEYSV